MDEDQKKISIPEIVIVVGFNAAAYGLAAVLNLTMIGALVSPAATFPVWAGTQLWLILKGGIGFRKQAAYLGGSVASFIPVVNLIPTELAGLIVTIYLINHPQVAQVAGGAKPALAGKQGVPAHMPQGAAPQAEGGARTARPRLQSSAGVPGKRGGGEAEEEMPMAA
ncbi:hypothetical protein HY504_02230 [Candidatus Wolfebacteria bacterium]|nr:hypothetical protein [Candidatus Wolfebacteria bacterium]